MQRQKILPTAEPSCAIEQLHAAMEKVRRNYEVDQLEALRQADDSKRLQLAHERRTWEKARRVAARLPASINEAAELTVEQVMGVVVNSKETENLSPLAGRVRSLLPAEREFPAGKSPNTPYSLRVAQELQVHSLVHCQPLQGVSIHGYRFHLPCPLLTLS